MTGCIVGWSHTPFGKLDAEDIESLIARVTQEAIADAGIEPGDIDEIYLGHYGGGFIRERFLSSMPLQVSENLRFTPSTRVENAKGHPIGATGISMHVMASMQLSGTAGAMQIEDPGLAGIFNMGGAAVAHYVSILERIR